MCGSMADIQSATSKIWRGKERKTEEVTDEIRNPLCNTKLFDDVYSVDTLPARPRDDAHCWKRWRVDVDLVQSQENQPQTHRSTRQISRELGTSQTNNWRWLFLFSFYMNVNEQIIIAFLTEKCCYLNLRSTVRTQLRWCGKFYYSRM